MTGATVTINGRLTADPVLRRTPGGFPVANFTVAHTPRRRTEAGDWEDAGDTLWLEVTAWRELAENATASLHKGDLVVIEGTLGVRHYKRADDSEATVTTCTADTVAVDLRRQTASIMRVTGSADAVAPKQLRAV
jgi:single-strand DNA-binding protein